MFSWQYAKSRNCRLVAGSGKEIRGLPVRKWQNIKMLQCCVPEHDEGFLSLMKDNVNVQNPHFKFYGAMSIILLLEVLEIRGTRFFF